jgi:predicted enzyme related to lactoylglutathione lyase
VCGNFDVCASSAPVSHRNISPASCGFAALPSALPRWRNTPLSRIGRSWRQLADISTKRISFATSRSSPVLHLADIYNPYEISLGRLRFMSKQKPERQIDYVEISVKDISAAKAFYQSVFDWKFEDYGPDYTSFFDGRLAGGFTTESPAPSRGVLLVIYASDLAGFQKKVEAAGGKIVREIFSFPGGRRFHFTDPNGIELAVWSDTE